VFDTMLVPMLPVHAPVSLPNFEPGRVVGLVGPAGMGLTRLGMGLLAVPSRQGPVAAVDVRGWLSPPVAWEAGVEVDRLVVVRCPQRKLWAQAVAALLEGLGGVYAEVPDGVSDQDLRRLAALARARRAGLVLRPLNGSLPAGMAHWRLQIGEVEWEGADRGHGRLRYRRLTAWMTGKGMPEQEIEVEDLGENTVRLVSGLVAAAAGGVAG
jgi:hypothetical protein